MIYMSMMDSDYEQNIFKERYEEFYPECLHIANVILHDAGFAEDAVHEAFLSIVKNRKKYLALSCSDFRKVIVIIVRNKCIDFIRKKKSMPDTYSFNDDVLNDKSSGHNVEKQAMQRFDIQEISRSINRLDEISRQILYMKYVQGLSYKEIGDALDMTAKNVEVRIYRAKKKVQSMMAEEGGD